MCGTAQSNLTHKHPVSKVGGRTNVAKRREQSSPRIHLEFAAPQVGKCRTLTVYVCRSRAVDEPGACGSHVSRCFLAEFASVFRGTPRQCPRRKGATVHTPFPIQQAASAKPATQSLLSAVPAERRGRTCTRSLAVSQREHGHHFQGGVTNLAHARCGQ